MIIIMIHNNNKNNNNITFVKMIEKLSKYKDLGIEISTIWGLKTETVSVVIGALGQV